MTTKRSLIYNSIILGWSIERPVGRHGRTITRITKTTQR